MKKPNKLFAILFAVLGVQTLSAQTDVTSTYLTNADFSSTDGWTAYVSGSFKDYGNLQIGGKLSSYTASTSDETHLNTEYCLGFQCRWEGNYSSYNQETAELPAGVYTLSYDVENVNGGTTSATYNNLFYVKVGDKTLTDTSVEWMKGSSSWTSHSISFVITAATKVTVSLGYGTGSNNFKTENTPVLYVSHLKLVCRNIDDISADNPADLTSYIVNNSFETGNLDGWTVGGYSSDTGVKPNSNGTYTTSGVDGNYLFNTWWKGTPLTQTVTNIPNGIYVLNVLVASGDGGNSTPDIYLLANGEHSEVYTISDGNNKVFHDVSYEFKVLNGQATIGVVGGNDDGTYNADGHWWYKADNFRLTYKGVDLSIIKEAYETALANATAVRDNSEYTNVVGVEKTNLVNAINLQPAENKSELEAATTALLNATTAFTASKSDYDALATEKTIAAGLGMTDESIASATAITKTGLVALQDLKVAEYNYIQGTYTENATLGSWTENFAEDLSGEGYKANGSTYFNEWGSATRTAKHTVKLPAGDYAISCIGRGQVGTSGYLYYKVGEETNKVDFIMKGNRGRGVDVDGVANFSDVGLYNCNGEGFGWEYRFITFHLDAKTEVEIGVSATFASAWVSIYAPVLLTTEASVKALRMTEIANLLSTVPTGKMDATVQSTLDEKKDAAEAASAEDNTIDELSTIATELNEAIIDANASIATYKTIATYIAKANNMDESIAAEYQTAYDDGTLESAETVFQELEVATYDYVKDEFSYPVELPAGNWVAEGPTGSKSEQHWSGEQRSYLEQSSTAWGQNAWSISYKQDKTLPAGDYVFKVSGRRAEGTGNTLSLVVTNINDPENPVELGVVNDFPEGDTGLGINKNGETSFDAEDEAGFANDGNGRGWQWRYVKFTLTDETTVQVAVEAEATTNHQWISFCDATLQMTEETYLEANKGALDAPTAEANALVDTNPMGTEENTALKDALALPVTTGAELLAKIEALETAVANANAWVAAYNEAKAPLVAALERFETELNDGVNGCKYNMVEDEDVWATLITEVGEAACTKDVTNDYYSFANAAEKLNNAIDEVHNWIRTNPTLNAKSATAVDMTDYYLVNASFDEGNTNGWEKTGSQTNNVAWSVTDGTFTATPSGSHYTGDAIWQKVNLAKGAYKLTVNLKAQEVAGHPSQVFVAGAAPSWNNNLSDLIASVKVTEFNKDIELSCIFNVTTDADVYIGFNQKSGNVAGTGIKGSYTIYDFTLTQAANQIITKDGVITVVGENEAADLAGISSDENIVKVDLTGATWNEASTLSIVNKNSLVYVTDDANLTANNIVKVGVDEEGNTTRVAKSIVLTEGYKFSAREAFTATVLNYAREFSANNWLTVCLPFAYEIPEGVKVETLGAVDLDTKTFTFNEVTGTMEANKPYIIKNSSETAALFAELGDVTVEATPEAMTVEVTAEGSEHKAEFIGTYTAVKTDALMENGAYDILFFGSDGQLYFLSQGVTTKNVNIKPFRAYIRLPKDAINWIDGQQAIARHGGGTTDIEDAKLTNDGAPVIYDLMGRKVNTIEKGGMYIVNGKKVVIR